MSWTYIPSKIDTYKDVKQGYDGNELYEPDNQAYRMLPIYKWNSQYLNGPDARLYLEVKGGDPELVAEVKMYEFDVNEPVMPIYGYASRTVDSWSRGTRLVQGAFAVNMKGAHYFDHILREHVPGFNTLKQMPFEDAETIGMVNDSNDDIATEEIEAKKAQYWSGYSKTVKSDKASVTAREIDLTYIPYFRNNAFTIYITYKLKKFGGTLNALVVNNITTIDDVHLTSMQVAVDMSGRPIEMHYQYLAGDYNRKSSALRMYR